jgi:hypothetical protein
MLQRVLMRHRAMNCPGTLRETFTVFGSTVEILPSHNKLQSVRDEAE